MTLPSRTFLPLLMVLLLALVVAACGSDDSGSSDSTEATSTSSPDKAITPGSPEAVKKKAGTATFAITPGLTKCMKIAGYTQDSRPAAGGIVSWTHSGGAKVVIAPSSEAALRIAGEVGTAKSPANVDGAQVYVGPEQDVGAAKTCMSA